MAQPATQNDNFNGTSTTAKAVDGMWMESWQRDTPRRRGPTPINVNRTGRYVRVQLSGTGSLALGEVQVWSQAAKVEWLVADQLGTPRIVVDKTGSLAGASRHDYLPFGEDLSVGRSTTPGYSGR